MSVKSNIKKVNRQIDRLPKRVKVALQKGMREGVEAFHSKMIDEQFSGRPGLRRQDGTAANSWRVDDSGTGSKYRVRLRNRENAWYIVVHQHAAGFNGTIRPKKGKYLWFKNESGTLIRKKSVYIPKRLHIPEDFRASGDKLIRNRIKSQLKKLKKKS